MAGDDPNKQLVIGGGASEDESSDELVFSSVAGAPTAFPLEDAGRPTQPLKAVGSGPASRTLQLPAVITPAIGSIPAISPPVSMARTERMAAVIIPPPLGLPPGPPPGAPPPVVIPAPAPVAAPAPAVSGGVVMRPQPGARQPSLSVLDAWGRPTFEFPLQPGRVMVGREQADLPLTQDPYVSRWHAALHWRAGALTIEDMASTNGVFLKVADAFLLEDGDEFILGMHRFVFLSSSAPLRYRAEREVDGVRLSGGAAATSFPRLMHLLEGGVVGGLYPLGERFHVGNKQGELVCPDDTSMSATHAVVERRQHAFYLRDLGSSLGSYIRINSPVELLDGDSFLVGRTRISVRLP